MCFAVGFWTTVRAMGDSIWWKVSLCVYVLCVYVCTCCVYVLRVCVYVLCVYVCTCVCCVVCVCVHACLLCKCLCVVSVCSIVLFYIRSSFRGVNPSVRLHLYVVKPSLLDKVRIHHQQL